MWLDAETVAREGFQAVMEGRTVVIDGALYRGIAAAAKYLPDPVTRALFASYARRSKRG